MSPVQQALYSQVYDQAKGTQDAIKGNPAPDSSATQAEKDGYNGASDAYDVATGKKAAPDFSTATDAYKAAYNGTLGQAKATVKQAQDD